MHETNLDGVFLGCKHAIGALRRAPRRWGTTDEVAAVVVHLLSDESAYATGAEFVLDGGITSV